MSESTSQGVLSAFIPSPGVIASTHCALHGKFYPFRGGTFGRNP
ncbi:MAG: hypothetical protein AVDCRST_MAG56-2753 [uncultured Cytophagales bacterium]|uniref:Uncharacterized protein n=1 Tax=uncultured Cytophagales bacterium TaxID=158755 RepID=A0A6J4J1V8_9SPHI|nr:MAG: hypothetical protein AVDCRST_MAG56-2753 [uncultured Cytophagales bacterium]